jgi:uncharacterized membrane protein
MINETNAIFIFGLSAAFAWGAGDFSAGLATKRSAVYTVILISHLVSGFIATLLALNFQEAWPPIDALMWGALAGLSGMLGALALYSGLAHGRMGIVAPLTAVLSALIPILFSFITEGIPPLVQLIGFGVALTAVWLLSGAGGGSKIRPLEFGYALWGGVCFAFFFIFFDLASETAVYWPVVGARVASITCIILFIVIRRKWERPLRHVLPFIILTGIADAAGNAFFSLATSFGRLALAAVLGSLYPATTVLLAQYFLHERLTRPQSVGAVLAITAVMLLTV